MPIHDSDPEELSVPSKTVTAAILLLLTMTTHAQGVVSAIAKPAAAPALPPPLPVPSANGTWNPFLPHAAVPPVSPPTVTSTAHAPIDPNQAALQARERGIRERGVRLGVIDGQAIYRHEGHYLIEPDGRARTTKSGGSPRAKRDSAECVIRVIRLSAEKLADNADQTPSGAGSEHPTNADSKTRP